MDRVVVTEDQGFFGILIMIGVHQPGFGLGQVNKLAEMQFGIVFKSQDTGNEAA